MHATCVTTSTTNTSTMHSMFFALIALSLCIASADVASAFSFHAFFQGEWEVMMSEIASDSFETFGAGSVRTFYNIYEIGKDQQEGEEAVESTDVLTLVGNSFMNDTDTFEITNERGVQLDFDGVNSGKFSQASSDGDMEVLFEFDFKTFEGHGHHYSFGKWNQGEGKTYEFLVTSKDQFSITVFPATSQDEEGAPVPDVIYLFSGKRVQNIHEKTFLERYGSTMMIGAVFLFNMYMQQRFRPQLESAAAGNSESSDASKKEN